MSNQPQASKEMFRSAHPRVNGVVAFVTALVFGGFSVLLFVVSSFESGFLVPAITMVVIAAVSVAIGTIAFQVRGVKPGHPRLLVPLRILSILAPVVAVAGAVIVVVTALRADPENAALAYSFIGLSGIIFIGSFSVSLQGAFIYGAADQAARIPA